MDVYKKLKVLVRKTSLGFIQYNAKVGISLDVDSSCPKMLNGDPCIYCYAEQMKKRSFMKMGNRNYDISNWSCDKDKFDRFLMELKDIIVENENMFVRIFSRSDYKREHKKFWQEALQMCKGRGVPTVVVTKQFKAVHDLSSFASVVQISIDNYMPSWRKSQATRARKEFENVVIRSVACTADDIQKFKNVDILTLFHNDAQLQERIRLKRAFPETTNKKWNPKLYKNTIPAIVCCAEKGGEIHAKCGYCGGCVKALKRKAIE